MVVNVWFVHILASRNMFIGPRISNDGIANVIIRYNIFHIIDNAYDGMCSATISRA